MVSQPSSTTAETQEAKPRRGDQALRLVLLYAVFSALWILLSDHAVTWLYVEPQQILLANMLKGWVFVAATSCLLYLLIRRLLREARTLTRDLDAAIQGQLRSEQLLTAIVERSTDAIYAKDLNGRYLLANGRALRVMGKTAAEVVGQADGALFPPDVAQHMHASDQAVIRENKTVNFELTIPSRDGELAFLAAKAPLLGPQGQVVGLFGISRDITDRKRMEQALRDSEERYRSMIERSPEAIIVHRDGRLLYANPAAVAMAGASAESELLGREVLDFATPETRDEIAQSIQRAYDKQVAGPLFETRIIGGKAGVIDIAVQGVVVMFDGAPAAQVSIRDITERKRTENALAASQARSRAMLDAIPDLLFELDLQGRYLAIFAPRSELLALPQRELLGRTLDEVLSPDAAQAGQAALQEAQATGYSNGTQIAVDLPAGRHWFELSIARKDPLPGEPPSFIALSRDITQRKHEQEQLKAALRDKDALLREVHHRVKNNLQVIDSLLRMEARRSDHGDTRAVLQDMQSRIHAMALLHETLYRSKTFTGVELGTYLRQLTTRSFQALSTGTGTVRLALDLDPVQVDMDQATPCGLLTNELISNCLKHGFPAGVSGEVHIALKLLGSGPECILRVWDTGIGLPADFEQRRAQSLGLQLAGDLAGQMGGRFEVGPGPGAEFTVRFTASHPKVYPAQKNQA